LSEGSGANDRETLERLGYRVVYVPHEIIREYNACYRVSYEGKEIYPPAADRLGIPLNEIWISEKYRRYERYILHHELEEIRYRAEGLDVESAHQRAMGGLDAWEGEELWEELQSEVNLMSKESLCGIPGIGEELAERIMRGRPYNRVEELRRVQGIGEKRLRELKGRVLCI
jgi:competence protein ComEA